ncbi:PP2C family protein-serine/threonine phosphatase [Nocardia sp. NPDC057353]|uniref:PP2C family protein-serine/threonine phosphatase n=1 Tax=Nocardia sp. NPDC057353 TaxID=3346104 RepID=UPI003630EF43
MTGARESSGRDRAEEQQRAFTAAFAGAGLDVEALWTEYFGIGGDAGFLEVDAYVHGMTMLSARDRDMLAHVVNEHLDRRTETKRATYSRPFRNPRPTTPPLSALVELVDGAHLAAPDRLPVIAHAAGTALGVELTVHLVDYEQRALRPAGRPGAPALDLDTTTAGRAFREVAALSSTEQAPTLWMPLLDGIERLGVLEIGVPEPEDLRDPGLRAHCRWVSRLLGHLVTITTHYGDGLDRARLTRPRTVPAELLWSLLPPRTAGVGDVVVSAAVEPRYELRGDVFDYAFSETTAQLLILDAAGTCAELIAATALAAYRSVRHAGGGLLDQARAIEEELVDRFGAGPLATAVLAELDLDSGRLRYVNAGHTEPLVMRGGTMADPLGAGQRAPLGLGAAAGVVGEEKLHRDDWLVLYTDGVTGAADPGGDRFGLRRLTELLRREASSGHPPPETVRQVITAVGAHHRTPLSEDATVLLVRKVDRATAPRRPEDERRTAIDR